MKSWLTYAVRLPDTQRDCASGLGGVWADGPWGVQAVRSVCHTAHSRRVSRRCACACVWAAGRSSWSSARTDSSGAASRPCVRARAAAALLRSWSSSRTEHNDGASLRCGSSSGFQVSPVGKSPCRTASSGRVCVRSVSACVRTGSPETWSTCGSVSSGRACLQCESACVVWSVRPRWSSSHTRSSNDACAPILFPVSPFLLLLPHLLLFELWWEILQVKNKCFIADKCKKKKNLHIINEWYTKTQFSLYSTWDPEPSENRLQCITHLQFSLHKAQWDLHIPPLVVSFYELLQLETQEHWEHKLLNHINSGVINGFTLNSIFSSFNQNDNTVTNHNSTRPHSILFGLDFFLIKSVFCSPRLDLFDHKYSKIFDILFWCKIFPFYVNIL